MAQALVVKGRKKLLMSLGDKIESGGNSSAIMGDEVKLGGALMLSAATPIKCAIKLIRNGEVIQSANTSRLEFEVRTPGVYRIEAWLEVDAEQRPWIYSNPIYVR